MTVVMMDKCWTPEVGSVLRPTGGIAGGEVEWDQWMACLCCFVAVARSFEDKTKFVMPFVPAEDLDCAVVVVGSFEVGESQSEISQTRCTYKVNKV